VGSVGWVEQEARNELRGECAGFILKSEHQGTDLSVWIVNLVWLIRGSVVLCITSRSLDLLFVLGISEWLQTSQEVEGLMAGYESTPSLLQE
jgi:hypothetical protein